LNLDGYGIVKGNYADLVVLQAPNPIEAIRIRPPRLAVVRRGEVIAKQQAQRAELSLGSRRVAVDFTRDDLLRTGRPRHVHAHQHRVE